MAQTRTNSRSTELKKGVTFAETLKKVAPFFFPFLLNQTGIFALVSSVPFFILVTQRKWLIALSALLTNLALQYAVSSDVRVLALVAGYWLILGFAFPSVLKKFKGNMLASWNAGLATFLLLVTGFLASVSYLSKNSATHPIDYVRTQVEILLDREVNQPQSPLQSVVAREGKTEVTKAIMTELPSVILLSFLFALWMNLYLAAQFLPGLTPKSLWSQFRAPEYWVWPTLLFGALFALGENAIYWIGLNGLKACLFVYGLQGLAIEAHFMNRFKIFGLPRTLIYGISVFLAVPFLLAVGFFDLWFDFRRKFRQS